MSSTSWILYALILTGILAFAIMRRKGQISTKEGTELARHGAMVIDVRSPEEYSAGHLSQALNMPVDEIASLLPSRVRDKSKVILLHCKTGLRSKKARSLLVNQGYSNVFDMGSYERAFKIVSGRNL